MTHAVTVRLHDTFKVPGDPQFIEKVRDVVGLYLDPPERAVLCVDEESQIQALDRSAPVLPMMHDHLLLPGRQFAAGSPARLAGHGSWLDCDRGL
jgi:hypothetical protein